VDDARRTYDAIAARLAEMSDEALAAALLSTTWRASVHGSQTAVVEIGGARVFVKQIALTDVERLADNEGSTANLFDLPLFYQYGIGSAGFGAWRELTACFQASAWALSRASPPFLQVYHWRVLPRTQPALSERQIAWLERAPARWNHSAAVRARLEAISAASASIVVFVEHLPWTLDTWLEARSTTDPAGANLESAILRLHEQWRDAAAFMNERGMLHFDLNPDNLLTDGEQLYVADFGLALCSDFDLSANELAFYDAHRRYDRCYADWAFVEWLAPDGAEPAFLTPALRARLERCAPVAKVFDAFLTQLGTEKRTPYPAQALEAAALPADFDRRSSSERASG
jgi:hypothetical protein